MEFIPKHKSLAVVPGSCPVVVAVDLYCYGSAVRGSDVGGKLNAYLLIVPVYICPAAAQVTLSAESYQRGHAVLILTCPAHRYLCLQLSAYVYSGAGKLCADICGYKEFFGAYSELRRGYFLLKQLKICAYVKGYVAEVEPYFGVAY